MKGDTIWCGHPALSRPLTILGVERLWFILSLTLGLAIWNAIASIMAGGVIFAGLYGAGWIAWAHDPNMLSIVAAGSNSRTRYDSGKLPKWHLELVE